MGLDIGELFGNVWEDVKQGANDVLKTGGNAALGYLEGEAIKILEADKAQNEKNFQTNIKEILQRPSSADSLGAYVANVAQAPVIKEYGPYILIGITLIAMGAIFLNKR